jgi:HK97 family phage prohead protease
MHEFLTRHAPFTLERAAEDGDGLTLTGYAAVFDTPTRIDSAREGRFDEQISRGAFADSLRERTPKLQFDHGQHPMVGSMPLGVIKRMHEDERGLYVEARLHDNWLIQPVRDAIASGAVDGMSFRFSVPQGGDTWDRSGDVDRRTITRATVYEVGPVVFPAYDATSVGVRSADLASLFDLPDDQRLALARALVLGTSEGVAPLDPSPDTTPDDEGVAPSGSTRTARALAFVECGILPKENTP